VTARWEGGWRCRVDASGFSLIVDEPQSAGGTGTGPMPTEYLLAAMASCYALALAWAAGKRGVILPGLAVTATGRYDGPRFDRLELAVTTTAAREVVERLVAPALRACYVSNTIAAAPPIEVVIGAPQLPHRLSRRGLGPAAGRGLQARLGSTQAAPAPPQRQPARSRRYGAGCRWLRPA
jgi:putative redox protein